MNINKECALALGYTILAITPKLIVRKTNIGETRTSFDPENNRADFLEFIEGMEVVTSRIKLINRVLGVEL